MTAPAKLGGRPAADGQVQPRAVADEHAPARVGTTYRLPAPPAPVPPDPPAVLARPAPSSGSDRVAAEHPVAVPGDRLVHLVLAVVLTLAVVVALAWLGQTADTGVPAETAVIRVGAGETVWDVAGRVAPESDPRAVVQRIGELNAMTGSAVQPGQQLRVPDGR